MQLIEPVLAAVILWGGIFIFLLYLLLRMFGIEKQLKIVESQVEGDQ